MDAKARKRILEGRCPKCGRKCSKQTDHCPRCALDLNTVSGRLENGDLAGWIRLRFGDELAKDIELGKMKLSQLVLVAEKETFYEFYDEHKEHFWHKLSEVAKTKGHTNAISFLLASVSNIKDDDAVIAFTLDQVGASFKLLESPG